MLSGSRDYVSTPLTAGTVESLNDLLAYNHHRYPRANLLNHKVDGVWRSISSMEMARRIRSLALGLYVLGVRKGDTVGLLSKNGPEWIICDYAMFACGAVPVPLYVTQIVPQIENILVGAHASVLFISNKQLYDRIEPALAKLPLRHIIIFSAFTQADRVITLPEVESLGDRLSTEQPGLYDILRASVRADDLASIIYTSGTTAMPKGVQLTHRNLLSNAIDAGEGVEWHPETDVAFSFLPLSHIFERTMINIYLFRGLPIYFAETIDTVVQNLREIRPTVMATVPRMLEKVYDRILAAGMNLAGIRRRLFFSSLALAKGFDPELPEGPLMRLRHGLYSRLVFSKWRNALGGRIRLIISGGAALDPRLARLDCSPLISQRNTEGSAWIRQARCSWLRM